jgi:hypothetical protein
MITCLSLQIDGSTLHLILFDDLKTGGVLDDTCCRGRDRGAEK